MRPAHATTTLLRDGGDAVLVDPSLPEAILRQRLDERTGLTPEQVNVVFLTNFRPIHRRGLALFPRATWLMDERELQAMGDFLNGVAGAAEARGEPVDPLVEAELTLLQRIAAAPSHLTEHVHLFPTPGATPGSASLLALQGERTLAVCGDAIVTREYFDRRQVFEQHSDAEAALQAVTELCEIADVLIPGHGDMILNLGW